MRISDLSRQSGVPVATIKFYVRERLLPPGEPTGRNQAVYGEAHLQRLQLIRAFTAIGELDLMSVRRLLAAIADERLSVPALFESLNEVIISSAPPAPGEDESLAGARADVDRLIENAGWQVRPDAPTRSHLALVLSALCRLGGCAEADFVRDYADVADRLAREETNRLSARKTDRAAAIAGSLLLEKAFAAIRRLALIHHVGRRFGSDPAESS